MTARRSLPSKALKNPHEVWMARAMALAAKGRFMTSPNPLVGACLVKGGRLIAEGFHARYGKEHAEVACLQKAGLRARGATLVVTLEPCATWGKTPPCASAIVRAGIREVIVGALDPNPKNHGKGIQALKKEGLKVRWGVLAEETARQNAFFFKYVRTGLPFVTLKMAQSLDGKIAAFTGKSRWITSPAARQFVHRLRAEQDAILVGKNTLFADDPYLSPRLKNLSLQPGKPWRVAMDPDGKISPRARIFSGSQLTLLAVSESAIRRLRGRISKKGAVLVPVAEKKGRLDLKDLLRKLASFGVAKLLVEGGGETAWSFLNEGLVDRACWIVAPKLIGGRAAKTSVEGAGVPEPAKAFMPKSVCTSMLGPDFLFEMEF